MPYSATNDERGLGDFLPIKPMGSVAAVINPINPDEALLFYCTDTYNLAIEHRALTPSAQSTTYGDNNVANGNITQPGDFAAVIHNSLIQCYGITNFTGGDGKPANVASSLSPSINPIDSIDNTKGSPPVSAAITGIYSALAATTDGQVNDFISFIQPNPQNPALPLLIEYTMNVESPSSNTFDAASADLLPTTRLTTCYRTDDPNGDRFIFAQANYSGNPLCYLSTDTGSLITIKGTNNAASGNPMAVTTATNSGGKMNMYLFYMDNANNLNKIVYDGSTMTWGSPKQVANGLQLGSGITVINDGKKCYAWYAKKGASTFTPYTGPL